MAVGKLEHLVVAAAELVLELHVARVDEEVDARARGAGERLSGGVDVAGRQRARAQTLAVRTRRATACTARSSAEEAAGNPASMTSTRIAASRSAMSSLSRSGEEDAGGLLAVSQAWCRKR